MRARGVLICRGHYQTQMGVESRGRLRGAVEAMRLKANHKHGTKETRKGNEMHKWDAVLNTRKIYAERIAACS